MIQRWCEHGHFKGRCPERLCPHQRLGWRPPPDEPRAYTVAAAQEVWLAFSPTEWRRPQLPDGYRARKRLFANIRRLCKLGLLKRQGSRRNYEYLRVGDIRTAYSGRTKLPGIVHTL